MRYVLKNIWTSLAMGVVLSNLPTPAVGQGLSIESKDEKQIYQLVADLAGERCDGLLAVPDSTLRFPAIAGYQHIYRTCMEWKKHPVDPTWISFLDSVKSNYRDGVSKIEQAKVFPKRFKMIPWREYDQATDGLGKCSDWDIYKDYPSACAFVRVTPVLFSFDGSKAVVYYNYSEGIQNSHDALLFLEKKGRKWVVIVSTPIWRS